MAKAPIPESKFTRPAEKLIFGIEFSPEGNDAIANAIADAARIERIYVSMFAFRAEEPLSARYGVWHSHISSHDKYVYLAGELDIDFKKFEHNVPKRSVLPFVALAKQSFPNFELKRTELQRDIQNRRIDDLWKKWMESDCEGLGCESHYHYICEDRYGKLDVEAVAQELANRSNAKKQLLESIDAKPTRKAAKSANDALARIAISSRR